MLRKKDDQVIEYRCIRGGNGETEMHKICESEEELYGKGRLFNHMILAPGNSIGEHEHEGDNEIFYFLKGTGEYNDNGTAVQVGPGDTTVCNNGEKHGLKNTGDEPLEFIALILY
ncbi:MAG: cupin domain-containing protein [Atopobiaceae bacterium]|nr:cupin domain-containing protein [Atopobiaceae bacterium]MDO4404009.1 cupin domain-containing protein [Atopobiaceae bacterium]